MAWLRTVSRRGWDENPLWAGLTPRPAPTPGSGADLAPSGGGGCTCSREPPARSLPPPPRTGRCLRTGSQTHCLGSRPGVSTRSGRGQGGDRSLSSTSRCGGGDRRGGDGAAAGATGGRQGSREAATRSQRGLGGGRRGDPERRRLQGDSKGAGSQGDKEDKDQRRIGRAARALGEGWDGKSRAHLERRLGQEVRLVLGGDSGQKWVRPEKSGGRVRAGKLEDLEVVSFEVV